MLNHDPKRYLEAQEGVQESLGAEYFSLSEKKVLTAIQLYYLASILIEGYLEIGKKKEEEL
jgi:hypothetical protein